MSDFEWTDPASELAVVCQILSADYQHSAADFLALTFETTAYSREFFKVLFVIMEKIDELINIVDEIPIDISFIVTAKSMINEIALPLNPAGLQSSWNSGRSTRISAQKHFSLGMLSGYVKEKIRYPKLSEQESNELSIILDDLKSAIAQTDLNEVDFVRDAAINYIEESKFIVKRLHFFGWRYGIYSLKELVLLYFAVENMTKMPECSPQVIAFHQRLGAGLERLNQGFKVGRDWKDNFGILAISYGAGATLGNYLRAVGLLPGT